MSKTAPPQFEIVDAEYVNNRKGPRIEAFDSYLKALPVGKGFDIPTAKNAKGKLVPSIGFNVKAANAVYAPKVFKKRRVLNNRNQDVLRVYRTA